MSTMNPTIVAFEVEGRALCVPVHEISDVILTFSGHDDFVSIADDYLMSRIRYQMSHQDALADLFTEFADEFTEIIETEALQA